MFGTFTKYQVATAIAILFHVIGIAGILFSGNDFFLRSTPFNLLLMFALLIWTQPGKNAYFFGFLLACFAVGVAVEIIGVKTGLLFGSYHYGTVLGYRFMEVPLLIGVNWFTVIYCSGISMYTLMHNLLKRNEPGALPERTPTLKFLSIVLDGALMAVFFDWLMEPVAVKLGYWKWTGENPGIPFYNYVCWFMVSVLLLIIFHYSKFLKQNKFAVNLLLIQLMFFLVLRTFLK